MTPAAGRYADRGSSAAARPSPALPMLATIGRQALAARGERGGQVVTQPRPPAARRGFPACALRIGNGAIIASGSVVTGHVPGYGVVGGNPAALIRRRYSDKDINRLLALAWWDWPLQDITQHIRVIMAGSIDDLEAAAPTRG